MASALCGVQRRNRPGRASSATPIVRIYGAVLAAQAHQSGLLRLLHLTARVAAVGATAEIRPGSVRAHDLAVIERALAGAATPAEHGPHLVDADGTPVEVPDPILDMLRVMVHHLKAGHGVSVVPLQAELTTVEAAGLLNVSRPHLIKQLESGAIPFRMVGTHRRVRLVDVLAYRDRQDAQAREALDELTRQAEDLGLYD
jgi:excisionase family DNA binding protein